MQWLQTKSIEQAVADSDEPRRQLKRSLGGAGDCHRRAAGPDHGGDVLLMGASGVMLALCRDGLLPRSWGTTSVRRKTPVRLQLLCGVVVAFLAGFTNVGLLEEMINIGMLPAALCLVLMLNLATLTWLRFGVRLVLGVVVYLAYGARHSRLRGNRPALSR